jgi:tRNA(Arg) A34 adenosine deaminase TadA
VTGLRLTLPPWTRTYSRRIGETFATADARVELAVELSHRNVVERTGGPFGAAVFERDTGKLVAVGVNRVEALALSLAHAEMMAIGFAQQQVGSYDLGCGRRQHEIVSSAQPCAMCAAAIVWSGVTSVVYAATRSDVERIVGFDEGPLSRGWKRALGRRGIVVRAGPMRARAAEVLELYTAGGGAVYNGCAVGPRGAGRGEREAPRARRGTARRERE